MSYMSVGHPWLTRGRCDSSAFQIPAVTPYRQEHCSKFYLNNVQTHATRIMNDVHNPEDRMIKRSRSDVLAAASCAGPDAQQDPVIPVIDVQASGPVEHARVSRSE